MSIHKVVVSANRCICLL